MAELSTIARPYAEAAFETAKEDSAGLSAWSEAIEQLAQVVILDDVRQVMSSPRFDKKQLKEIFDSLLPDTIPQGVKNFTHVLIDNSRWMVLPEIATQFESLKNNFEGSAVAKIYSAFELSEAQVNELLEGLAKKFGHTLKPQVEVDSSLIGGIRVVVGDQVLDTSVQTQLARLHDTLVAD